MSEVTRIDFVKVLKVSSVGLETAPDEKYPGRGGFTLADRQMGSSKHDDGQWLGFRGTDLEAVITLEERSNITKCSVGILNKPGSWIYPPAGIEVQASVDGISFVPLGSLQLAGSEDDMKQGRNLLPVRISPAIANYLKVTVRSFGAIPSGHAGEGEPAWLFVDEIVLE